MGVCNGKDRKTKGSRPGVTVPTISSYEDQDVDVISLPNNFQSPRSIAFNNNTSGDQLNSGVMTSPGRKDIKSQNEITPDMKRNSKDVKSKTLQNLQHVTSSSDIKLLKRSETKAISQNNQVVNLNSQVHKVGQKTKNSNDFDFSLLDMTKNSDVDKQGLEEYEETIAPVLHGKFITDKAFPPNNPKSISRDGKTYVSLVAGWKRLPDIYRDAELFSDNFQTSEFVQGTVRYDYLFSSLLILSKKLDIITRAFHNRDLSFTGYYSIWIHDSGEVKLESVDDHVPLDKFNQPIFTRAGKDPIWLLLLEKLYAKYTGSYYDIKFGNIREVFFMMTGAMCSDYQKMEKKVKKQLNQPDFNLRAQLMWEFVNDNHSNKFLMCGHIAEDEFSKKTLNSGLNVSNTYGIYDIKEYTDLKNQMIKAVKIRSPFGKLELNGMCKVRQNLLVKDLAELFGIERDEDPGMMWIRFEDFVENFDNITVCKVHNNYKYRYLKTKIYNWKGWGLSIVTFDLENPEHVYLSVHQKHKRHFYNSEEKYRYSYMRVLFVKISESGEVLDFIKGKFKDSQQISFERSLESGRYLAFIEIDWAFPQSKHPIYFAIYSRHGTKPTSYEEKNFSELYEKILRCYIRQRSVHIKIKAYGDQFADKKERVTHQIYRYGFFRFGLYVYLFENKEKEINFDVKLTQGEHQNMKLFHPKPAESNKIPIIKLKDNEDQLVIFKTIPLPPNSPEEKYQKYKYNVKINEVYKYKYSLSLLKDKLLENAKKEINDKAIKYHFNFNGGFGYYIVSTGKGQVKINIDTTVKGLVVEASDMNGIKPNNKFEKDLEPGKDFMILYQKESLDDDETGFRS